MADKNQVFIVSACTREGIAEAFSDYLENIGRDERFSADDDRLTDAICQRFAQRLGEVFGETADEESQMVDELIAEFLIQELGFKLG